MINNNSLDKQFILKTYSNGLGMCRMLLQRDSTSGTLLPIA